MRRLVLGGVLAALVLALGGCGEAGRVLDDEAACPGETCTDDTRARLEAVAALDGVTEVETVARREGADRGSVREARLRASVATRDEAHSLLLEVLRALEDWPEHDSGPAVATVTADPEVVVPYRHREEVDLATGQLDECSGAECDAALDEVGDLVARDYDDVSLDLDVRSGLVRARATTTPEQVALVAAAIRRHLLQAGARVADRAVVDVRSEGPLVLTLRLDDEMVCEQPRGQTVECEPENSVRFGDG